MDRRVVYGVFTGFSAWVTKSNGIRLDYTKLGWAFYGKVDL